jgi:3-mercaptopyruvate sulfurtransferase SseA
MKLVTFLISLLFAAQAHAGLAGAVSADDAQAAIAQGAYVLDVRAVAQFAAGHLPQASVLPTKAASLPLHELSELLTQQGIDSSRTMLVVGDAGDTDAQALWQRLASVTSGRVLWLVGGVQEWQMRGLALTTQTVTRARVPQFLASFEAPSGAARMAGSKVRSSGLVQRDLSVKLAFSRD